MLLYVCSFASVHDLIVGAHETFCHAVDELMAAIYIILLDPNDDDDHVYVCNITP